MNETDLEYAGFWVRVGASLIDSLLVAIVTLPLLVSLYGWKYFDSKAVLAGPGDFLISWVLPAVAVIWFWMQRQATPGKALLGLRVVDAESCAALSLVQGIRRYLSYFVSIVPFGLGLLWVAFDDRKQGWHDKLADTVVVRSRLHSRRPVPSSRP